MICVISLGLAVVSCPQQIFAAGLGWFDGGNNKVITKDINDVVGKEIIDSEKVLRDGSYTLSDGVKGIYNDTKLEDTGTSREKTANYVKGLINYFLSLAGLVALLYLLYHGFLAVTAGTDEDQLKKGMQGVRYAGMAIIWVGVARFLVSGILWLTFIITENL